MKATYNAAWNPFGRGLQGSVKELWTTEWFLDKNTNSMVPPWATFTEDGVNVNVPFMPTITVVVAPGAVVVPVCYYWRSVSTSMPRWVAGLSEIKTTYSGDERGDGGEEGSSNS